MNRLINRKKKVFRTFINKAIILCLWLFALNFIFGGCNFHIEIDGEEVEVDEATFIYTYKESGKLVTGTVVFYALSSETGEKYKERVRELKKGKRINKGYNYHPNGAIAAVWQYDQRGLTTGTINTYYENGTLRQTVEFKDGKQHGVAKQYYENGILQKTAEYKDDKQHGVANQYYENGVHFAESIFENGVLFKAYGFIENERFDVTFMTIDFIEIQNEYEFKDGRKIFLTELKTGYWTYAYSMEIHPTVHMKWKNNSDVSISETIEITAVFIDGKNSQELGQTTRFLQAPGEVPLLPGLWREVNLISGYTTWWGRMRNNELSIYCHIYINDKLYVTLKIENNSI
jgi:hypothetical protein